MSDILTMRWEHVSQDKISYIPFPKMKKPFFLPVDRAPARLVSGSFKAHGEARLPGSPWVLPSVSKSGHLMKPTTRSRGRTAPTSAGGRTPPRRPGLAQPVPREGAPSAPSATSRRRTSS